MTLHHPSVLRGSTLHLAAGGRLFVREAGSARGGVHGASIIIGVVELPRQTPVECLVPLLLDKQGLHIDASSADPLTQRAPDAFDLADTDVNHILTSLRFRKIPAPGSFEALVRKSVLPDKDAETGWFIVAGVAFDRLPATPHDGLYELGREGTGLSYLDAWTYKGMTAGQVLRETLWGPDGRFGLSTSMEPGRYPAWLAEHRFHPSTDPMYLEFLSRMPEAPLFYTAEDSRQRDREAAAVIREIRDRMTMDTPEATQPEATDQAVDRSATPR